MLNRTKEIFNFSYKTFLELENSSKKLLIGLKFSLREKKNIKNSNILNRINPFKKHIYLYLVPANIGYI